MLVAFFHSSLHNLCFGFAQQLALKLPVCFNAISKNRLTSGKLRRHLEQIPSLISTLPGTTPPFSSPQASAHLCHKALQYKFVKWPLSIIKGLINHMETPELKPKAIHSRESCSSHNSKRFMHPSVHSSTIYNSQDMEET